MPSPSGLGTRLAPFAPDGPEVAPGEAIRVSSRLKVFVCLASLLLAFLIAFAFLTLSRTTLAVASPDLAILMFATFLAILAELKPTRFYFGPHGGSEVSLSMIVILPVAVLYGWPLALLLSVLAVATTDIHAGKAWYKIAVNAANYALSTFLAGTTYAVLTGGVPFPHALPLSLAASALMGFLFFLVNTSFVGTGLALIYSLPMGQTVLSNARLVAPVFFAMIGLSVTATLLWTVHPFATVLLIPPMLATKLSYEHYVRLRQETDNFLIALADAVDMRDPYTAQHSHRVAQLSQAIARRLKLGAEDVATLGAIARVHDVGKLVVRDAILLKDDVLTAQEYEEMKGHVEAGVRILERISLYRAALEILAQHHERLDGSGYPRGLRGDEIIFPARVLAVADAYDAMTTDRPYRPAKTPEEAVRELYRVAGKEYDLNVVRALEDELIARGVLKGPVVPAALEAARQEAEAEAHAAARTARVVPLPRVGSGRNPS